jgi:hypothetical protein
MTRERRAELLRYAELPAEWIEGWRRVAGL